MFQIKLFFSERVSGYRGIVFCSKMAEGRSRQRSTVLLSRERPKMGPPRRVRPQLEESNDEIESDLKNKETGEVCKRTYSVYI